MSELTREDFEQAAIENLVSEGYSVRSAVEVMERGSDGEYRSIRFNGAWWGWIASRAQIVIELPIPKDFPDGTGDYHQMIDPDDLIDAIHAAGVKTK